MSEVSTTSTAPWISAISRGSLVIPSQQFLSKFYKMEKMFTSFHKDTVSHNMNVITTFHEKLLSTFPELPGPLLKKYARTRTFLRIRFLNNNLKAIEEEKYKRQKRKQFAQFSN